MMTRLAVSIFVDSVDQALAATAIAAERGADLVEFRLDRFADQADALPALIERSALPCIVTCRPTWEGGEYEGDEDVRAEVFRAAASGPRTPVYMDIELVAYQKRGPVREAADQLVDHPGQITDSSIGLILSSHDFDSRPIDLYQRLEGMVASPACRVMKVAWRAKSLRDNLEAFEVIVERHKPTIALCMGEFGLASRVLAKKFGALLTFAAIDEQGGTAPGQPTIADLKSLYRWDSLDPSTRVYGVIGYPVGHSMSPAIHNAGFDAVDHAGVYLPMPIPPEYEHFKATVATWLAMDELQFRGASVTIPHKENLLRFVEEQGGEIEPLAAWLGAANTLTVGDDGKLRASNTDYAGALDAACSALGIKREALAGKRVAVIGAGGAARAIVAGFVKYGATVVVYNRTHERAVALAEAVNASQGASAEASAAGAGNASASSMRPPGKAVAARMEKLCDSCCEIYINCTPVGMHPNVDDTPIPAELQPTGKAGWGAGVLVFDTIYNPRETRLLREAKAAGCMVVAGDEMFVRQAAAQFEQWVGKSAPLDVFRSVLLAKLGG